MDFNTFSALYGATIATSSFSGSGYTGSLVQAAQDLNYTLTITTGSNVGDPLQVTSSFGDFVTHSFTTSSFNERTSSAVISDATPFQSILVQGTVQGVNATTPVVFSSPISGSHITSSGNISSSNTVFGMTGSFTHLKGNSPITVADQTEFLQPVTSSIISASNTILGMTGSFAHILGNSIFFDPITIGSRVTFQQSILSTDITASGGISASGTVFGLTGSFSHLEGNSPITIGDQITFQQPVTASGIISASGNIFGDRVIAASYLQAPQINGSTEITGDLTTVHITASGNITASGDLFAHDILLVGTVADSPNIQLMRAGVTGANLKMGGATDQRGELLLNNSSGNSDIVLQGGAISYFPQSLKIGVPYTYPENNPATLTVGGNISGSGNLNISEITSSGALTVSSNEINFTNLPTSDPGVAGRLYRDGGTVKVSI